MRRIVAYMLLICIASSSPIYARVKARLYEIDIILSFHSDDEFQSQQLNELNENEFNEEELIAPPRSYSYPLNYCSIRNKKNNPENERAKIAISTGVLLGIAILGMIFVSRDSH